MPIQRPFKNIEAVSAGRRRAVIAIVSGKNPDKDSERVADEKR
jgi:hypothetical protein